MIDLDAKIRSLVERNVPRKDIVSELDAIASDADSRAKRFERAKKKGDRYRTESERALSARVGRILFFLHHGVPAQGATDASDFGAANHFKKENRSPRGKAAASRSRSPACGSPRQEGGR